MSNHAVAGRRAAILGLAAGLGVSLVGRVAVAQEAVKLFKVITSKDEITIGVTASELAAMGSGEDVKVLAQALVTAGQITVWQYAVGRDAAGALQMNPLRRVAILKADSLRIEPATTTYKIAPPKP
jgi:hypothetical protein